MKLGVFLSVRVEANGLSAMCGSREEFRELRNEQCGLCRRRKRELCEVREDWGKRKFDGLRVEHKVVSNSCPL